MSALRRGGPNVGNRRQTSACPGPLRTDSGTTGPCGCPEWHPSAVSRTFREWSETTKLSQALSFLYLALTRIIQLVRANGREKSDLATEVVVLRRPVVRPPPSRHCCLTSESAPESSA